MRRLESSNRQTSHRNPQIGNGPPDWTQGLLTLKHMAFLQTRSGRGKHAGTSFTWSTFKPKTKDLYLFFAHHVVKGKDVRWCQTLTQFSCYCPKKAAQKRRGNGSQPALDKSRAPADQSTRPICLAKTPGRPSSCRSSYQPDATRQPFRF